ncbi:hypothetical protein [Bacillus sp. FJAT-44742]|uniref:hypothetical protein n=1 Tax=Bacillus sp. FJAT-44742 TaxID=2014005 RepID=UPI000C2446C1|nr:hypothetical protein [Bacillus sp. FJAT-44742]
MKLSFMIASLSAVVVFTLSLITGSWYFLIYISGSLGVMSLFLALFVYLDSVLQDNKESFFSEYGVKKDRREAAKVHAAASVPNLTVALIYLFVSHFIF